MAVRTDIATVKLVIETDRSDDSITQYIGFASSDVDNAVALSTDFAALGVTVLTQIETLLAAHYTASLGDPRAKSEEYGESKVEFQQATALGYDSSHYGQMALRRDPTGTLAAMEAGSTGSVATTVLGPG